MFFNNLLKIKIAQVIKVLHFLLIFFNATKFNMMVIRILKVCGS